jgi:hypothetical protein
MTAVVTQAGTLRLLLVLLLRRSLLLLLLSLCLASLGQVI